MLATVASSMPLRMTQTPEAGRETFAFDPMTSFSPFFAQLLPGRRFEPSKRGGATVQVEVFFGPVSWKEGPGLQDQQVAQMEVWPATPSRPGECRIAKVHEFGFSPLVLDDPHGGKSVFMLIQTSDGDVYVWFTTETILREGDWDPVVKRFAEAWLEEGIKAGFLDLVSGEFYPND